MLPSFAWMIIVLSVLTLDHFSLSWIGFSNYCLFLDFSGFIGLFVFQSPVTVNGVDFVVWISDICVRLCFCDSRFVSDGVEGLGSISLIMFFRWLNFHLVLLDSNRECLSIYLYIPVVNFAVLQYVVV